MDFSDDDCAAISPAVAFDCRFARPSDDEVWVFVCC